MNGQSFWGKMPTETFQWPCDDWGGSQLDRGCQWSAWWSLIRGEEEGTQRVWPCWHGKWTQFYRGQRKEQERKEDRKNVGLTTSKNRYELLLWRLHGWGAAEDMAIIIATSPVMPRWPSRLRDWDEMRKYALKNILVLLARRVLGELRCSAKTLFLCFRSREFLFP